MARDLDAERQRRAALETNAEAAKREADGLKAKIRAEQQKGRQLTLEANDPKLQERPRQTVKTFDANKNIVRSSFSLPNALRPIRF